MLRTFFRYVILIVMTTKNEKEYIVNLSQALVDLMEAQDILHGQTKTLVDDVNEAMSNARNKVFTRSLNSVRARVGDVVSPHVMHEVIKPFLDMRVTRLMRIESDRLTFEKASGGVFHLSREFAPNLRLDKAGFGSSQRLRAEQVWKSILQWRILPEVRVQHDKMVAEVAKAQQDADIVANRFTVLSKFLESRGEN